jgi:hypothetical protein
MCRDVRDIRRPTFVRPLSREVLLEQVVRYRVTRIPLRSDLERPLWTAVETGFSHQSGYLVPAALVTFFFEFSGDLRCPIHAITVDMNASDQYSQFPVCLCPMTLRPDSPGIETTS